MAEHIENIGQRINSSETDAPDPVSKILLEETVSNGREEVIQSFARVFDRKGKMYSGRLFGLRKENCYFSDIYNHCLPIANKYALPFGSDLGLSNSPKILEKIASHVLTYCIKEYDEILHGSSFETWMQKRIQLVITSLKSAKWEGEYCVQSHGTSVIKYAAARHRTVKNVTDFYAMTHDSRREDLFAEMCASMNISGDTHEERVFAATIYYAPIIYCWLSEGNISADERMLLSSFDGLNRVLWTYEPSSGTDIEHWLREDFFTRLMKHLMKRKKSGDLPDTAPAIERAQIIESEERIPKQRGSASPFKSVLDEESILSARESALLSWASNNQCRGTVVKKIQGEMITQYLPKVRKILFPNDSILNESETSFAFTLLNIAIKAFHPSSDNEDFEDFVRKFTDNAKDCFSDDNLRAIPECKDHQTAAALVQAVNSGKYVPVVAIEVATDLQTSDDSPQEIQYTCAEDFRERMFPVAKRAVKAAQGTTKINYPEKLQKALGELLETAQKTFDAKALPLSDLEAHVDTIVRNGIYGLYLTKTRKK